MSEALAFGASHWFFLVFAYGELFVLNTYTFFDDVVGCWCVYCLHDGEGFALCLSVSCDGFNPLDANEGVFREVIVLLHCSQEVFVFDLYANR